MNRYRNTAALMPNTPGAKNPICHPKMVTIFAVKM
jgi:hypothetical protein